MKHSGKARSAAFRMILWTFVVLALMLAMPGGPSVAAGFVQAPVSALGTALVCGTAESVAAAIRRP